LRTEFRNPVSRSGEYRRFAAECLKMAQTAEAAH
jgi:hypothetical protein